MNLTPPPSPTGTPVIPPAAVPYVIAAMMIAQVLALQWPSLGRGRLSAPSWSSRASSPCWWEGRSRGSGGDSCPRCGWHPSVRHMFDCQPRHHGRN